MLPEFAIIGVASACCNPYTRCAQSVGLVIFVLNTVCPCLGCVNDMRFFKKVVQKISLNRLIHRKTWGSTENSLEKVRISAETRWKNVQGRKMDKTNGSYTMLRVFFTTVHKKWVRPHYIGIPIYDNQMMQRSHRRFVLNTVSSCQTVRMAYTDNCTIDSSIINNFRTIYILTKKSRYTPVVRLLFFCCQRTKEV